MKKPLLANMHIITHGGEGREISLGLVSSIFKHFICQIHQKLTALAANVYK